MFTTNLYTEKKTKKAGYFQFYGPFFGLEIGYAKMKAEDSQTTAEKKLLLWQERRV